MMAVEIIATNIQLFKVIHGHYKIEFNALVGIFKEAGYILPVGNMARHLLV